MIVKTMTTKEVLKQLQKDYEFVMARLDGLRNKNSKKLKNKHVKSREILSRSKYVIPETNDTAVVYAIKFVQTVNKKEYASMTVAYYIKTCYGTYIISNVEGNYATGYHEVSHHAIERLTERLGKDFDTFFKEDYIEKNDCILYPVQYSRSGDNNVYVAHVGDAFLVLAFEDKGNRRTVKTILATENLYSGQMHNDQNSTLMGEAFRVECRGEMAAENEEHLKMYRKIGILKKTG